MYCQNCGAEINDNAVVCVKCGCAVKQQSNENMKWVVVLLLCFFLGGFGAHRFYLGKVGTGVAMLLTCGGCGVWALIDFIMILLGNFTDAEGNKITMH